MGALPTGAAQCVQRHALVQVMFWHSTRPVCLQRACCAVPCTCGGDWHDCACAACHRPQRRSAKRLIRLCHMRRRRRARWHRWRSRSTWGRRPAWTAARGAQCWSPAPWTAPSASGTPRTSARSPALCATLPPSGPRAMDRWTTGMCSVRVAEQDMSWREASILQHLIGLRLVGRLLQGLDPSFG